MTRLRTLTAIFSAFFLAQITAYTNPEKPKLVRGESYIDVPAIADGLCLHNIFQSGMVLQRDKALPIWGWAAPGEKVTVSFAGQTQEATAADDRSWKVNFPAMPANSEGQELTVKGKDKTITLTDLLIGDIWVLGGQSNMEFPISKLVNGRLEIVSANFPKIRHITIPQLDGPDHRKAFPKHYKWSNWSNRHYKQGYWETCTPETVHQLSGMGYVFARRLHMATQVPIGVVDISRGGTTVETWAPLEELRKIDAPEAKAVLAEWDQKVSDFDPQKDLEARVKRYEDRIARFKKEGKEIPKNFTKPNDLRKGPIVDQNKPGNCFASSIAPLAGFPVKGAIFHQGYNNCFKGVAGAKMYYQVFGVMIKAWRNNFADPEMPFGIISLCTGGEPQDQDNYVSKMFDVGAYIREAQYKTYLDFKKAGDKHVGFASSFDQRRSWYHPQIKIPVGERIAKWALTTQYGIKLKWEPPYLEEMKVEDGKIILKLNAWTGPHNDGPIHGFAIAGEDGKFQPADAEFLATGKDGRGRVKRDRKVLVLSSPMVPAPLHFRYAWSRNPMANLKADSIPFATQRSDNWTLLDLYEKYTDKKAKADQLDRTESHFLKKALHDADLERRLFEARDLIEKQAETDEKK